VTRPSAYFPLKKLSRTCKRTVNSTDATLKSSGRSSLASTESSHQAMMHSRTMTRSPNPLWAKKKKKRARETQMGSKIPVTLTQPVKKKQTTLKLKTISRFSKFQRRKTRMRPFPWFQRVARSPPWSHSSTRDSSMPSKASKYCPRSSLVVNCTILSQKCTNSSEWRETPDRSDQKC